MKKLFVQIHDRFSSSTSFDMQSGQPSNDKITLEQTQTTPSKSQEHKNQKWRKRFSISAASLRKRHHEKNNNSERIFQSLSTPCFDKKKEGQELMTIISNSSTSALSTTALQQRDIDNNKLETRQENNHYIDDDFYDYCDLGPARPFSCTATMGRSNGEKGKRQEKGIIIDEMNVSDIAMELRLGNSPDPTSKNNNNDDDDSFIIFRYEKDTTANISSFSDLHSPTPISKSFIRNNHNISNNDALKSNNDNNQHNCNHDISTSICSNTFQYNQHDPSKLSSTKSKEKNNKNLDETNKPASKDAVLHLHAWKSAASQTENQSFRDDGATKRHENNQEEEHVLQLNMSKQVNDGGRQNKPNNFQHYHDSNNTNCIVKKFIHDDVTMAKNVKEANVHVNNCFSHEIPTKKQTQLSEWNSDRQQQQERFGTNINCNSSTSSMNDELQDCHDSITSQRSKVYNNIIRRNNSIVTDLSIGDDTPKSLLSQHCTVPAQTIMTKNCTVPNNNTNSISSYATNDRKSNRTIDVASESQGKQGTSNDAATIVKIQVEKTIMEMTLARKINDVLDTNASLNERIRSMEEIINQSTTSTTIEATNTMISSIPKEKNKIVGGRQQQDKILRTHTLAQLGLIEYLEGESDLASALERFKKQLETELSDSK